jgi:hypothetical protein
MTIERYRDDKPDLSPRVRLSKLLQALSPAVAPGSPWPDAKAGDFLMAFDDDSEQLFPRIPGVTFLPVVSIEKAVEWTPERGSRSAPVEHHDFVPADAEWIDVGGRKACIRSSNGNRIEKTVFVHMLVGGFKTTFSLSSTAYNIGQSFSRDADKVRVTIDDEVVRVCGALWRMTSELERNQRSQTWFAPRFEKLGVLGQPTGPTLEQVRVARDLRFEFKLEEEKRKAERAALSTVKPTPALTRGTMSITTGIGLSVGSRSWAAPKEPEPPAKTIDPKLNDDLDSLPWND